MSGFVLWALFSGLAVFLVLFGRSLWMGQEERERIRKADEEEAKSVEKARQW